MKIHSKYKLIVASATLFSLVFGLLVVCHNYFTTPVLAATISDRVVSDIVDNNINLITKDLNVCQDEQVLLGNSLVTPSHHKNHQGSADGLMPCCYEKAPSNSSGFFEIEPFVKILTQVFFGDEPKEKLQINSFKILTHGPPISSAELSRIIAKRE